MTKVRSCGEVKHSNHRTESPVLTFVSDNIRWINPTASEITVVTVG